MKIYIEDRDINPYLLKCLWIPAAKLEGFQEKTGRCITRKAGCYEIVLFCEDGGSCYINGQEYPIVRNAIRFLKPGDITYSYRYGEIYVAHFTFDRASGISPSCNILDQLPCFMPVVSPNEIQEIFENLILAMTQKDTLTEKFYLWKMIHYLKKNAEKLAAVRHNSTISKIEEYLVSHYRERITLEDLSSVFHLNANYIQRFFKAQTGISPLDYVISIRLTRAYERILLSDESIEEVAQECGFNSPSYFIQQFKKKYKDTPYQIRKNRRESAGNTIL